MYGLLVLYMLLTHTHIILENLVLWILISFFGILLDGLVLEKYLLIWIGFSEGFPKNVRGTAYCFFDKWVMLYWFIAFEPACVYIFGTFRPVIDFSFQIIYWYGFVVSLKTSFSYIVYSLWVGYCIHLWMMYRLQSLGMLLFSSLENWWFSSVGSVLVISLRVAESVHWFC